MAFNPTGDFRSPLLATPRPRHASRVGETARRSRGTERAARHFRRNATHSQPGTTGKACRFVARSAFPFVMKISATQPIATPLLLFVVVFGGGQSPDMPTADRLHSCFTRPVFPVGVIPWNDASSGIKGSGIRRACSGQRRRGGASAPHPCCHRYSPSVCWHTARQQGHNRRDWE